MQVFLSLYEAAATPRLFYLIACLEIYDRQQMKYEIENRIRARAAGSVRRRIESIGQCKVISLQIILHLRKKKLL